MGLLPNLLTQIYKLMTIVIRDLSAWMGRKGFWMQGDENFFAKEQPTPGVGCLVAA
jgi:hypothetical protein